MPPAMLWTRDPGRSRLPKTWVMEAISASELAEITPRVNACVAVGCFRQLAKEARVARTWHAYDSDLRPFPAWRRGAPADAVTVSSYLVPAVTFFVLSYGFLDPKSPLKTQPPFPRAEKAEGYFSEIIE